MRLVFLGTPNFAVPTLEAVARAGHDVCTVVSQPDRPRGRGQVTVASPVKQAALKLGIPVFQPERIRGAEAQAALAALGVEVMVVVGYGQIIPQAVIDLAPRGILNVHASLLPKYRGAAPIQWAIANGEARTGVTTMQINAGLDTGDILLQAETAIAGEETAVELSERLAPLGAELLVETLAGLARGTIVPRKQDDALATYAPILKKEDGRIDWSGPASRIHNQIRGLLPWPGAYTTLRGQLLHIWRARVASETTARSPGHILAETPVRVAAGDGSVLELIETQLEGRKKMPAEVFARGQRLNENDILGEART
ncbi:MAG: methionyl-tRNA formyltransferase [Candidatus Solibacter usitatus]|nr:methionyl-tRNA formyltransferase [Candidatus Solibacter usitatus]